MRAIALPDQVSGKIAILLIISHTGKRNRCSRGKRSAIFRGRITSYNVCYTKLLRNTFYIITRSLHQGLAAGVISSLGILVGTVFHISAAAFGLSALLLSSALAFTLVKYAGAAYLVYLGLRTLLSKGKTATEMESAPEKNLTGTFYQGVLVNVLNPKTGLFFVAFLPQFLDVHGGSIAGQIFILGGILILLGVSSDMTYALLAGKIGNCLSYNFV